MKKVTLENITRINNSIRYIEENLDNSLKVQDLAKVACYSTFHFHRIFVQLVGETPSNFIVRKRIEKIIFFMLKNKNSLLQDIVFQYGYNSSSSFAKSFKKIYGINATDIRDNIDEIYQMINIKNSKIGQLELFKDAYNCSTNNLLEWTNSNGEIAVKTIESRKYVYIRKQGDIEKAKQAFLELRNWVITNQLEVTNNKQWAWIIHDNPAITDNSKISHSACFLLDEHEKIDTNINTIIIPEGRFAVGTYYIDEKDLKNAWEGLSLWIMNNGYVFRNGIYHETLYTASVFQEENKHKLDLCIPIE